MMRLVYTALSWLLLPYALLRLAWRARREPKYLDHLGERFGRYALEPGARVIWVHAVSLGETRGAESLVEALLAAYPQHRLLITHMTPTGRDAGLALYGRRVMQAYLPYDNPVAVRRFLAHFTPRIGIVMETEIWPNLIRACARRGVPLFLVNARMSERSARGYARVPGFTREVLNSFTAIVAQSESDASRFSLLGANNVEVAGNLKFDIDPPPAQLALGDEFRARYGARPVLLAASTRESEEDLVLDAAVASAVPQLLVVIVPRHAQRFDEVAQRVAARGVPVQRRSENRAIDMATGAVLGDSLGELFAYYRSADVAFIGGSLVPWGGHNLIEACAVGTPVLIGPHTMNFAEASESAVTEGAALRVATVGELAAAIKKLFANGARRAEMRSAALRFAGRHRGATGRILALISRAMR